MSAGRDDPAACITEREIPQGYRWLFEGRAAGHASAAIMIAGEVAATEARKRGKTYVVARAAAPCDDSPYAANGVADNGCYVKLTCTRSWNTRQRYDNLTSNSISAAPNQRRSVPEKTSFGSVSTKLIVAPSGVVNSS